MLRNSTQWITFKWCLWRHAVQESLSRTTTSHIQPIDRLNPTKLGRYCFDWTNVDWALWNNGWCFLASASPRLCRGAAIFWLDLRWSCVVRKVFSICNVGVICISLLGTIPFPRGKIRACTLIIVFYFCSNTRLFLVSIVQDLFSLHI